MKKIAFFVLLFLGAILIGGNVFAALPRSAMTEMTINIYGIYTTSDPTCMTGLVATLPLSISPTPQNMVERPTLGKGSVPSSIKCVVIIMKNAITASWAPGTYDGNDSYCNAGGTQADRSICGSLGEAPTWPATIANDMTALGLLPTATCSNNTSEIIPIFMSTYSACTGNQTADEGVAECPYIDQPPNSAFNAPTMEGDSAHGLKITAPATADTYKFIVDPNGIQGGWQHNGVDWICDNLGPPKFSFEAVE